MVCGFGKIHGLPVGIVANNGILFSDSSLKAAHFIQLCGQRKVPILFVQNVSISCLFFRVDAFKLNSIHNFSYTYRSLASWWEKMLRTMALPRMGLNWLLL